MKVQEGNRQAGKKTASPQRRLRRKRDRTAKKKSKPISQEGLNEVGHVAKQVSELVQELVSDGVNPYSAALALECQVQAYCRQTGANVSVIRRDAESILDDPRIEKP